ncbi:LexA family transcriptional regulator [Pseudomonas aeruginosa]|uniref:LexA family transcriptional regulator n=1 Tax=Pseudomonas aeruginosa TaxID=287 RepID=UPI00104F88EB|nr:helix-turn-helix transcriptional regulator [Pseudomonas aeruginosa]
MTTDRRELLDWERAECAELKAAIAEYNAAQPREMRFTQERLAAEIGMAQGNLNGHLNGKRPLSKELAVKITATLGIPVERYSRRLAEEIKEMARTALPSRDEEAEAIMIGDLSPWDDRTPLDDDEVELPLYKEVELAAGSGRTTVQEIPGRKLRFSYTTLRAAGVDPAAAVCAQLKGNSMEPLIMNGATVGIDKATTRVVDGEIYALEHDGMLRVKYLYRLPGGGLRLRSFNRDEYGDEEYTPEDMQAKSISIIGWVFWWSTLRSRGAFKR